MKKLIPSMYHTTYECEGKKYVCIWKQWMNKCIDVETYQVV